MDDLPPTVRADEASGNEATDTTPEQSEFTPGRTLGPYRLVRRLGRGGFSEVWEAERQEQRLRMALKILHDARGATPKQLQRFAQEGRLAASLSHPRCLYVYSAEQLEGIPAIAMELAGGGTLQERLDREGPLPAREAVDCILDVLEGLEAAEQLGIVHRDIKPSNCFVDEAGRVKIGDFGISKSLQPSLELTTIGSFLGTPVFASPEQFRGQSADSRSDQYSVGATLYALLAGHAPFQARGLGELMARILTEPPPRLDASRKVVPRGLEAVVLRMLHKDSAQRFPTLASARAALLPFSSRGNLPAKPLDRIWARLLDLCFQMVLLFSLKLLVFGAYLMHQIPITLLQGLGASLTGHRIMPVFFFVYVLCEWAWQGTPGKRLLNLRIQDASGGSPSLAQVLLRNTVYLGPGILLLLSARRWLPSPMASFAGLLFEPLMFATMRAGNGFAGLHEIMSRTRVQRCVAESSALAVRTLVTAGAGIAARESTGRVAPTEGPYRLVRRLWQGPSESLTLAVDEQLGREVWIHERSEIAHEERPRPEVVSPRPTRLRWLRGGQREGLIWNAYEAPSGVPFGEYVRQRGRLAWADLHGLLVSLCEEVVALEVSRPSPLGLSLGNLWIDAHGQLRVHDFPWNVSVPRPDTAGALQEDGWRALLQRVIVLGLEGVHPNLDSPVEGSPPERPCGPLPDSASTLLLALWEGRGAGRDPESFRAALVTSGAQRTTIQRWRRLVEIGLASFAPMFSICLSYWLFVLSDIAPSGNRYVNMLHVDMPILACSALVAMVLAWAFRGGPLLQLLGIRVQALDGHRASRARCLERAAWAAVPAVVGGLPDLIGALLLARAAHPSVIRIAFCQWAHLPPVAVDSFEAAMLLVIIAGAWYAIVHPERGLHDRFARTRLVPR